MKHGPVPQKQNHERRDARPDAKVDIHKRGDRPRDYDLAEDACIAEPVEVERENAIVHHAEQNEQRTPAKDVEMHLERRQPSLNLLRV